MPKANLGTGEQGWTRRSVRYLPYGAVKCLEIQIKIIAETADNANAEVSHGASDDYTYNGAEVQTEVGPDSPSITDETKLQELQVQLSEAKERARCLEERNEGLVTEMSRYRNYWINECRLADARRLSGDECPQVSAGRWDASSPCRDYRDAM